jgi:hypothetical protein
MPQLDVANWVAIGQMFIALGALGVVIWYTLETRWYRRLSEKTLIQLQAQHDKAYEAYVRVTRWKDWERVEVTNLGPAPALNIRIRASFTSQSEGHPRMFLQGYIDALVVGQTYQKKLDWVTDEQSWEWYEDLPEHLTTEIRVETVTQKEMHLQLQRMERGFYRDTTAT